jgi:hypothetical protein
MGSGEQRDIWVRISKYIPGKIFIPKLRVSRNHLQKHGDMCANTLPRIELAVSGTRSRYLLQV